MIALGLGLEDPDERLDALRHVHANVRHSVLGKGLQHWDELSSDRVNADELGQGNHSKQRRLPMQVVCICVEGHESGDGVAAGPLGTENLGQLLQVFDGCLPDREDRVLQPGS